MRNSRKGRFRVWDRSQDSFNGEDLVYNFDNLDEIIGGPDGGSGPSGQQFLGTPSRWLGVGDNIPPTASSRYPGSTNGGFEQQTGRRTLYSIASGLNYNDVPLGTVIAWWRPTSAIPVPDGWTVCDGREVPVSGHSFPISASITLPDLRNKFIIGADETVPGINAVNGYALEELATPAESQNNYWTGSQALGGTLGAPGVGYDSSLENPSELSGDNRVRSLTHLHGAGSLTSRDHTHGMRHRHTVPGHSHLLPPHTHDMVHVHLTPNHFHNMSDARDFSSLGQVGGGDAARIVQSVPAGTRGAVRVSPYDHTHTIRARIAGQTGDRDPYKTDQGGHLPNGGLQSPWPYGEAGVPPKNIAQNYGYTTANPTSYPTRFVVEDRSSGRFRAHDRVNHTGNGVLSSNVSLPFGRTDGSDDIQTTRTTDNSGNFNLPVTEGISGSAAQVATSRGIDGETTQVSLQVNVRPQYVGLLYLMKVKVSTNII